MIKIYKALLIISCSIIVAGCPSAKYVTLKNASTQPISVIYSNNTESLINTNETKKETAGNCINIKSDNKIYDYNLTWVIPADYISRKTFSTTINAIYTDDHTLKVYNISNPNDFVELDSVCPY